MSTCPNIKSQEFLDLKEAVNGSEPLAYLLWNRNNGNPLHLTPDGKESSLYKQLLERTGNPISALRQKTVFYSNQYLATNNWLEQDKIIEPDYLQSGTTVYQLKAVDILLSDKAKQMFDKGQKNNWTLDKILTELAIPKEQKQLLLNLGITNREQLALELASKYGFNVEINITKQKVGHNTLKNKEIINKEEYDNLPYKEVNLGGVDNYVYQKEAPNGSKYIHDVDGYYKYEIKENIPTDYYSNLTVPGGTNYTENEISTPLITPSIKGHAQFSTDKGIGWFRSDEQGINQNVRNDVIDGEIEWEKDLHGPSYFTVKGITYLVQNDKYYKFNSEQKRNSEIEIDKKEYIDAANSLRKPSVKTKTRRILEIQSDLFQKGRGRDDMAKVTDEQINNFRIIRDTQDYNKAKEYLDKIKENQFLQLLNKDNNWVTFFIKSIIQDSAKKGYEKVLFPKGETAAKIEGHETIVEELQKIDKQIQYLIDNPSVLVNGVYKISDGYIKIYPFKDIQRIELADNIEDFEKGFVERTSTTDAKARLREAGLKEALIINQNKIESLQKQKLNLKSQGIEKLKPIEAFYEIKIGNILEKQFGKENVKTITDEYGNQWREVNISDSKIKEQTEVITLGAPEEILEGGLYPQTPISRGKNITIKKATKEEQYIAQKKYQINSLYERKASAKTPEQKTQIQERITMLQKDIAQYEKNHGNDVMFMQSEKDLRIAEHLLSQAELNTTDVKHAAFLVQHVLDVTDIWTGKAAKSRDFLEFLDGETVSPVPEMPTIQQKRLETLKGRALRIQTDALNIMKKLCNGEISKIFNEDENRDYFQPIEDIDMASSWAMSADRSGVELGMALDRWKKEASFNARENYEVWQERIAKTIDTLSPEEQKLLLQEVNGKFTGNFVHFISQDYFDARTANLPKNRADGTQWKKYFKWLRQNSIQLDPRKLFYETYNETKGAHQRPFTEKDREAHIAELKTHLGEELLEQYIGKAKRALDQYLTQRKLAEEEALNKAELLDTSVEVYMEEWEERWSPYAAIQAIERGYPRRLGGEFVKSQGSKYLHSIPRRTVDGKDTGWYDKKYELVHAKGNEKLREAYDTMVEVMETIKSYFPETVQHEMQINMLPVVTKSFMQQVTSKNVTMLEAFTDKFQELFYDTDFDDNSASKTNPLTGEVRRAPKIKMIKDAPIEERSLDLPKILRAFAFMGETYKYKTQVDHNISMLSTLLQGMEALKVDPTGAAKKGIGDSTSTTTSGLENLKGQLNAAIDSFFEVTKPKTLSATKKLTRKDKIAKEELDEEYLQTIASFNAGSITEEEMNTKLEEITLKQTQLGHHFSYTGLGHTMLMWNQLRGMGWNVGAGIANTVFGSITNMIHAAAGIDFTMKEYWKATNIVNVPFTNSRNKLSVLMKKYNVLKNIQEIASRGENTNESTKGIAKFYPYEIQRTTEYIIHAKTFVAAMLHNKTLKDKNGNTVSLWDAYDNEGKWDVKKMGPSPDWAGDPRSETDNQSRKKFEFKIAALVNRLHGNYDPNTSVRAKRYLLGQALLQFRSWMPESVATRWEKEKFDKNLDRMVKGRYRSFAAYYRAQGGPLRMALGMVYELTRKLAFQKTTFEGKVSEEFTEVDAANMRANMQEIMIYLMSMAAFMVIKSMFKGSDDDDEKAFLTAWLNQISRLQGDMSFYINPQGTKRIMNNAIPVMKLGDDLIRAVYTTYGAAMGDKDWSDAGKAVGKVIPGAASAVSLYQSTQKVY